MRLGIVDHGQPNLPKAVTIEGFHQGSKLFQEEVISDEKGNMCPGPLFYSNRLNWYLSTDPGRYKYYGSNGKKNIPICFIWVTPDGKEQYLDYITSRQFYCNFYSRLAPQQQDYVYLKSLIDNGYNLQICGYDAYHIDDYRYEMDSFGISTAIFPENIYDPKNTELAYLNPSHPFGHERVLYTMLTRKEKDFPWIKYKTFDF
jgi:hypothetical protein